MMMARIVHAHEMLRNVCETLAYNQFGQAFMNNFNRIKKFGIMNWRLVSGDVQKAWLLRSRRKDDRILA